MTMLGTTPDRFPWFTSATLASVAAFSLPALCLFAPSGYSWGALLLVVLGLSKWRNWRPLPPELKAWAWTIGLAGCMWTMHILDSYPIETRTLGLDRPLKYCLALLAVPSMLILPRWHQALPWGCAVGGGLAGVVALWEVIHLELPRAEGHSNAINFGNVALLLATWSALWALQPDSTRPATTSLRSSKVCLRIGCLLGLVALILSGSRGGWMTVPLLGTLVVWQWRHRRKSVASFSHLPLALTLVLGGALLLNTPVVFQRIEQAKMEWVGWMQTGDSNSSVGQRLAHWQFAWDMFTKRPLTGWGQAEYDLQRILAIDQGRAPEALRHFNHAHNEWLDMAAKRGAVGLLTLATLFGLPGWLYTRKLRSTCRPITRTLALCGLSTVLGYLVFGLTQVMFAHNVGNMVYLFMNTLWLGALTQQPPESDHA